MFGNGKRRSASLYLAGALLLGGLTTSSQNVAAQSAERDRAPDSGTTTPDGFIVTPARPLPRQLNPDGRNPAAGDPAPQRAPQVESEPQGGGCRYQERPLELIV